MRVLQSLQGVNILREVSHLWGCVIVKGKGKKLAGKCERFQ